MRMAAASEMTDYKPAPEATDKLNFRVPKSLRRNVENVVRLWRALAVRRKDDPTNIDITHVCTELLLDGVQLAFKNYVGIPQSEEQWERLERSIQDGTVPAVAPKSAEVLRLEAEVDALRAVITKLKK